MESVVLADPDFDLAETFSPIMAAAPSMGQTEVSVKQARLPVYFSRLLGTREEGEQIATLLGVSPWLSTRALEGRLKARRSPYILHIASHGFFLPDHAWDEESLGRGFSAVPLEPAGILTRPSSPRLENPLLRSGLALAGANTWCRGDPLPPEAEDGILTAEDVTGLDLLGTELVVLSACEERVLGTVRTGEGVFGLRRAFFLAGARTLIVSLWKVPDQQTKDLMIEVYRRLMDGTPRADALRQAQMAIREREPSPFWWGAFICLGDPGPLPPVTRAR